MAKNLDEGFNTFINWLAPLTSEHDKAKTHKESVKSCMINNFKCYDFFETGSFGNGTGVRHYSDTDYFAVCPSKELWANSSYTLQKVKEALQATFWRTSGIAVSTPAVQIPYQAKQLMNKSNSKLDRGMAGLQLAGNVASTLLPGVEDVAWAGIQGVKNYNKSSLAGGNLKQNLTSFKKGATGEEFAGLGDAFLAGDSAARDILNMAELPVALLMGASIKNGQNVGFDKGTVEKFKNALQDPETRTLVQDFANMVENAKNPNRMNPSITEDGVLKDLGNRMQLMADDLFGRKTGTLSNTQLKNLFDILYQQAGDASRFNLKKIQLGASTQNIREGIDAQAGVTDAVNPLIQEAKKYGSAEEVNKLTSSNNNINVNKNSSKKL